MRGGSEEYEDGVNPYAAAMWLFERGCKFVGFTQEYGNSFEEFVRGDQCPRYVASEIVQPKFDILESTLLVGFGEYPSPADEIPVLRSYKVTSLWYKPIYKTDVVEAEDESDAEYRAEQMY